MKAGIQKCVDAAGSRPELAKALGFTAQALHQFYHAGWLPLERAKQAAKLYDVPLRELVKPEIADALDAG